MYYGTELNNKYNTSGIPPANGVYPNGKEAFPNLAQDFVIVSHLPMPWDQRGLNYTSRNVSSIFEEYIQSFQIDNTVQASTSLNLEEQSFAGFFEPDLYNHDMQNLFSVKT